MALMLAPFVVCATDWQESKYGDLSVLSSPPPGKMATAAIFSGDYNDPDGHKTRSMVLTGRDIKINFTENQLCDVSVYVDGEGTFRTVGVYVPSNVGDHFVMISDTYTSEWRKHYPESKEAFDGIYNANMFVIRISCNGVFIQPQVFKPTVSYNTEKGL